MVSASFCQVLDGCILTHTKPYTGKQDAKPHFTPHCGPKGGKFSMSQNI